MATTQRPDNSVRTTDTAALELAAGEKLIVDRGIVLSSASSDGVSAAGDNVLTVAGTISGNHAIRVNAATVNVTAYGVISGDEGIYNSAGYKMDLVNRGMISGDYQGLTIYGSAKIENHGAIVGGIEAGGFNSAIYLGSSHTKSTIINYGSIKAKNDDSHAIYGNSEASDKVVNFGVINGDVLFGYGDDSLNTTKGRVIGTIDGGDGEDTLKGSKYSDTLIGGADHDKLTGGPGASSDIFEFVAGAGKDVITDFDAVGGGKKQDYISLVAGMEYEERSAHNGRDTILDFGDDNTITLLHVKASDFSDADIHFV